MIPDQNASYAHVSVRDHGTAPGLGAAGVSYGTPVTPVPQRGRAGGKAAGPGGRGGAPGCGGLSGAGVGAAGGGPGRRALPRAGVGGALAPPVAGGAGVPGWVGPR